MLFGTEVCRILDSAKEPTKWEKVSEQEFITVRIMIKIILSLFIIIQIPFIAMAEMWSVVPFSFEWWMMQFFGFVMATNLGAVILAMIAQDSATKIGAIQSTAFTAEFMEGVETLTKIMTTFNETASEENESLDSQIDEIAPAFYRLALQYLRTHALPSEEPPTLDELGIPAADFQCEDSELFESENPKT